MGLTLANGMVVFIDTAPLIYYFERHEAHIATLERFFENITQEGVQLVTSMMTYIELLTGPTKAGDQRLSMKYREYLLNSEQLRIHPLDPAVADAAIEFRINYNLKTPDAIQLGTAFTCGADAVLTNDRDWSRVKNPRIVTITDL